MFSKKNILILSVFAVIAVITPLLAGTEYIMSLLCLGLMYVIAVNGLDVLCGYCGQISFGHAAFYAIGAYSTVLLHNYASIPVLPAMLLSSVISTLISMVLALPASKLIQHFLSLSTIAFGEITYQLILHSPNSITGNASGIFMEHLDIFGFRFTTYAQYYWFALGCTAIFLLAKQCLVNGKTGRAFMAIRENTHSAAGLGINVRKYKIYSFAISAFYTSFAGAMYVSIAGFICPDMFTRTQSVLFITMMLFGGTASLMGPAIGVAAIMAITESLRSLSQYQVLVYGIVLLIVIVALPGGIFGAAKDLYNTIRFKINGNSGMQKGESKDAEN